MKLKKIIDEISNNKLSLNKVHNILINLKQKINSDYELIFNKSKSIGVYHELLKEIGYLINLIEFCIEGAFNFEDYISEITSHLKNIDSIYSKLNLVCEIS